MLLRQTRVGKGSSRPVDSHMDTEYQEPALGRRAAIPFYGGGSPPCAGARVNLRDLWAGRQRSLLGGRLPIATDPCDRRRAITACSANVRSPKPSRFGRRAFPLSKRCSQERPRSLLRSAPKGSPGISSAGRRSVRTSKPETFKKWSPTASPGTRV